MYVCVNAKMYLLVVKMFVSIAPHYLDNNM